MRLPPKIRRRFFYTIRDAGAMIGWSRAESYRAVERGDIPAEQDGRLLLVPREKWDRIVRRLLRGPNNKFRRKAEGDLTKENPGPPRRSSEA
jgi:hypothetical protein